MFPQELIVPPQKRPLRLDKFLVDHFPKTSRAFWKKHLEEKVRVEGKRPKKGALLMGGERLYFLFEEFHEASFPPDSTISVKMVHKDPDFLIVEKPCGVPVHPLKPGEKGTLVQGLLTQYPEIASIGTSKREMGLVHRLDNETSGLVLLARTPEAYHFLREEFQKRRVEKEYFAIVEGNVGAHGRAPVPTKSYWEKIEEPIGHHPKNQKKMIVTVGAGFKPTRHKVEGRSATTFFKIEKNVPGYTLLRVRIPTGVRHQIRVHLAHLGHPVVGDRLYGSGGALREPPQQCRLFLHAHRLVFRHPKTLKKVEFESDLPEDFKKFLKNT